MVQRAMYISASHNHRLVARSIFDFCVISSRIVSNERRHHHHHRQTVSLCLSYRKFTNRLNGRWCSFCVCFYSLLLLFHSQFYPLLLFCFYFLLPAKLSLRIVVSTISWICSFVACRNVSVHIGLESNACWLPMITWNACSQWSGIRHRYVSNGRLHWWHSMQCRTFSASIKMIIILSGMSQFVGVPDAPIQMPAMISIVVHPSNIRR